MSKRFIVALIRTIEQTTEVEVEAPTAEAAYDKAIEAARAESLYWDDGDITSGPSAMGLEVEDE